MGAIDVSGQAPGGKRHKLAEVLPLETPYLIEIFPIYACNLKCNFCIFSTPVAQRGFISSRALMDLGLYEKCIREMSAFPDKIKVLRFAGMGEPLMHGDIVEMVRLASESQNFEKIEILTNATCLHPAISNRLIEAGLGRLYVSLEGLSSEQYKKVAHKDIDFDLLVENLKYFYRHRGNTRLHIKIMDYALRDEQDLKRFFELFQDHCDTIGIENASPIYPYVDYKKVLGDKDPVTQFGLKVGNIKVCPQPFFRLHIIPDGKVIPCYNMEYPEIVGDANFETITDIWNGEKLHQFRMKMLDGTKFNPVCQKCTIIRYRLFSDDMLDNDAERLKKVYASC